MSKRDTMPSVDNPHHERTKRSDDTSPLEAVVTQLSQQVTSLEARLQAAQTAINGDIQAAKGVVGGAFYNHEGGSSNRLCLTLHPVFDSITHDGRYYSSIYGAEYEHIGGLHNHNVPCAVCKAVQTSTIMVPGTNSCPYGWTQQYHGHLTGNHYGDHGAAEFLCLDGSPESRGSSSDEDGVKFLYTVAKCGSLPCSPYEDNRVVTCVVCSQ